MKIAISAESTHDLNQALIERYDVKTVPFEIVLKDQCFKDGEICAEEIFAFVEKEKGLPKTNALNEFEYTEYFESLKKDYDAVIHICLSGEMSSSCNNAKRAAQSVGNVYIVDSRNLSTGIGLLVIYARELADMGLEPLEIQKRVQERTSAVQASFIVEKLDYLYKGGRCNSLALLGANLLKIRPRIVVKDGKMSSDKKYRGSMGSVISKYGRELFEEFNTPDLSRVFITYSSATEEMVAAAKEVVSELGFKEVFETRAGATVTSHCGANTLGILYFNDGDAKN